MKIKNNKNKGFTLIEIVLYFAIVGVFSFLAVIFAIQVIKINYDSENFAELQSNANLIEYKLDTSIKTASSVNLTDSVFDNNEGKLVLNMNNPDISPSIFYFSEGDVFIKQGLSNAIKLNSEYSKLDFLRFSRISFPKTPDQINVKAQIGPRNSDFSNKTLQIYLTVSLRSL